MIDEIKKFTENNPSSAWVIVIVLAVFLFCAASIPSSLSKIKAEKELLAETKTDMAEIEHLLSEYKSLPDVKRIRRNTSIPATVERIATELSIVKKMRDIKSLTKKKKNGAEVKFTNLSGREITALLYRLNEENIKVVKSNFKDNSAKGLWTVSLILEG